MKRMITYKDVAAAAGVSTFTVSQALTGKAGVSEATRARVQQAAEALGYVPNAVASLMSKNRGQGGGGRVVIAQVTTSGPATPELRIAQRCAAVGLDGREVLATDFKTPQAMLRRLWAMGVHGLFLHFNRFPWSEDELLACDWSKFSVVKFGRLYPQLGFHLVRHSAFDYMRLGLRKVLGSGYRRVAVLLFHSGSEQDDEARLGAVLTTRHWMEKSGGYLEWRYWEQKDVKQPDPECLAWLREFRPNAILAFHWAMAYPLLQAGWKIPGEVAFAAVLGPLIQYDELPALAGARDSTAEFGQRAIAMLAEMIARGERGLPKHSLEQVIEPVWEDGESLPGGGAV